MHYAEQDIWVPPFQHKEKSALAFIAGHSTGVRKVISSKTDK